MKVYPILFLAICLILSGCSSVQIVTSYKDPDTVLFQSNKLLVVGMAQDMGARQNFETKLQTVFEKEGTETIRSVDLFDVAFTEYERTEEELDQVEQQLLDKDFDAILLTKVIGSETRTSLRRKIKELGQSYEGFREDYLLHQGVYFDRDYYETATDYFAETSLYCICVGKERSLIWRSVIHITDPKNLDRVVKEYIDLITDEMESQQLILGIGML
jgi:uncharacterized protein YceK